MRALLLSAALVCAASPALADGNDYIWAAAAMRVSNDYCGTDFTSIQQLKVAKLSGLSRDAETLGTLVGLKVDELNAAIGVTVEEEAFCDVMEKFIKAAGSF